MYHPGETICWEFATHDPTTGAAADATGTPTAKLLRNNADSGEVVTVAKVVATTGLYTCQVVIPTAWVSGDVVQLRVTATVAGVTGNRQSNAWVLRPASTSITSESVNLTSETDT